MAKKKRTNPRKKPATVADVERAKRQATRDASLMPLLASAMTLHDVFGFGTERIERFVVTTVRRLNDWDAGLYSTDDALQWFEEYTGMKIEEVGKR